MSHTDDDPWSSIADDLGLPDETSSTPTTTAKPAEEDRGHRRKRGRREEPVAEAVVEEPLDEDDIPMASPVTLEEPPEGLFDDADADTEADSAGDEDEAGGDDEGAASDTPDAPGESEPGKKKKRRRRRRRRKGGGEGAATPTTATATEPVAKAAPVDEEEDFDELPTRRESMEADEAHHDSGDEEEDEPFDASADWDVPSWDELIATLYKPER